MATDDWFRNAVWNSTIEAEFEARLKRSRGTYSKSQYLRIQASYLLESSDLNTQLIGVNLMERLLHDFPTEEFSVILGQEQLGNYYLKKGIFDKAEVYFREVTNYCENKKSRSGTSGKADLKIAETILTANWIDKLEEAYSICKNFPLDQITFNNDKFYYSELAAHICDKLNKKAEAKEYAKAAIAISTITEPQFYRHKTIGLVKTTDKQLRTLEQIANE